jgi:hypothetical protein
MPGCCGTSGASPSADDGSIEDVDLLYESDWVILARDSASLGPLLADPSWETITEQPLHATWTDDFSNLVRVLDWRSVSY